MRPVPERDLAPMDFESVAQQLASVDDLFSGGGSELVSFDSAAAKSRGTHVDVIALAEEMAAFSNDLIRAAGEYVASDTVNPLADLSPLKYGRLTQFFGEAAALVHQESDSGKTDSGLRANGWCHWYLTDAACTCGHWLYPQPTSAVKAKQYKATNPTSTLKSWGYHPTPNLVGGGWTLARTHYASRCGTGTFRDHAWIAGDGKSVWEQNYAGRTPRGEPNPEFWKSAKWAYPTWPAYVYWWHQNY